MIITDAMIIKFLVENLRTISENKEMRFSPDRFVNGEFYFYREEVQQFSNTEFEVVTNELTEKVRIKFSEK